MPKLRRNIVIYLLSFSQFLAWPHAAEAKTPRRKPSQHLLKWVDPNWTGLETGNSEEEALTSKANKDLKALIEKMNRDRMGGKGSNGTGSGSSGSSKQSGLTFNENAAKGQQGSDDVGDRGGEPPTGGGDGGNRNKPEIFPLYWPMCMFFDPGLSDEQANSIVKGTIDMAGACGVNLFVVPMTVKRNYSIEPDSFNKAQQASCNMQSIGISVASTMLAHHDRTAAARMCKVTKQDKPTVIWDEGVAGCAQVRSGGGMGEAQEKSFKKSMGDMGFASDGIIPSVIVPQGYNAGVASHEALGHSQMGWPNYENKAAQEDAGLGIGTPEKAKGASLERDASGLALLVPDRKIVSAGPEGDLGESSGWTGLGCDQMRKRALANTKRFAWDKSQAVYFKQERNPEAQWQLGKPLWGTPPPGAPPTIADRPLPPPGNSLDEPKLFFDEDAKKGNIASNEVDGKHRKKPGAAGESSEESLDDVIQSLRKKGMRDELGSKKGNPKVASDPKKPGSSLTFDDTAKKADGSTPPQPGDTSSGASGGSGATGGGGLTFNEDAAKGSASQNSGSSGSSREPASVGSGSISSSGSSGSLSGSTAIGASSMSSSLDGDFFGKPKLVQQKLLKRKRGEALRQSQPGTRKTNLRPVESATTPRRSSLR